MSLYSLFSSILSYVFTTIIYLFIFSIIVLIYKDIKKIGKEQDNIVTSDEVEDDDDENYTAILKNIKNRNSVKLGVKSKYRIGSGPIVVGRGADCDISILDQYLSQKHFEIYCKSAKWYLKDLKSKNGTFVNGARAKKPVLLEDEDVISFGDVQFIFYSE